MTRITILSCLFGLFSVAFAADPPEPTPLTDADFDPVVHNAEVVEMHESISKAITNVNNATAKLKELEKDSEANAEEIAFTLEVLQANVTTLFEWGAEDSGRLDYLENGFGLAGDSTFENPAEGSPLWYIQQHTKRLDRLEYELNGDDYGEVAYETDDGDYRFRLALIPARERGGLFLNLGAGTYAVNRGHERAYGISADGVERWVNPMGAGVFGTGKVSLEHERFGVSIMGMTGGLGVGGSSSATAMIVNWVPNPDGRRVVLGAGAGKRFSNLYGREENNISFYAAGGYTVVGTADFRLRDYNPNDQVITALGLFIEQGVGGDVHAFGQNVLDTYVGTTIGLTFSVSLDAY